MIIVPVKVKCDKVGEVRQPMRDCGCLMDITAEI